MLWSTHFGPSVPNISFVWNHPQTSLSCFLWWTVVHLWSFSGNTMVADERAYVALAGRSPQLHGGNDDSIPATVTRWRRQNYCCIPGILPPYSSACPAHKEVHPCIDSVLAVVYQLRQGTFIRLQALSFLLQWSQFCAAGGVQRQSDVSHLIAAWTFSWMSGFSCTGQVIFPEQ